MAYRPAIRRRAEARLYLEARAAAMKGCLSFMTACYFDRNDDFSGFVLRDGSNSDSKDKSGFLHCAPHDVTVRRFGRNDDSWVLVREKQTTTDAKAKADPYGMTTRKANATTTAYNGDGKYNGDGSSSGSGNDRRRN
jgi:hypothetical protein